MRDYLDRYRAGDCTGVWEELGAIGELNDPEVIASARAVAAETMRRVARNIDAIIPRLHSAGYRFGKPGQLTVGHVDSDPIRTPPDGRVRTRIARLEKACGVLPVSLGAWFEIVGEVNLVGHHPAWPPTDQLDPLLLPGLDDDRLHYWLEEKKEWDEEYSEPFHLDLAPDHYTKANISGGTYDMHPGCLRADETLLHTRPQATLVTSLRNSLRYGGLPGLARHADCLRNVIDFLTAGLEPI